MKPKSLTKLAAVSALALSAALYAAQGNAQEMVGTPVAMAVGGTVENDLELTVVAGVLKFSATGHATDIATASIDPATGVATNDPGTGYGPTPAASAPASLVFNSAAQTLPSLTIDAGEGVGYAGSATLYMGVTNVVDMVCGGTIRISHVTNNQATKALVWDRTAAAVVSGSPGETANFTAGTTIKFGVSLSTSAGTTSSSYTSGACGTPGSIEVTMSY